MLTIQDLNFEKKRVLIRLDLNVPIEKNKIVSHARIKSSIPTIKKILKRNAKVILMSHLGRPKEGIYESKYSLFPVFEYLKKIFLKTNVYFFSKYEDSKNIKSGELCLLENVRFNIGETTNNLKLSLKYSNLCDIFIMDAFGSAHRKHASTYGISKFCKKKCIGPLVLKEINSLNKIFKNPVRPMVSILGGSKISTKFKILNTLGKISDYIIVGGGIANTFIAINNQIGKSLHEKEYINKAYDLLKKYKIIIPIDSRVSTSFHQDSIAILKDVNKISKNEEIMDIGLKTEKVIQKIIKKSNTIIWNGPVGVFEFNQFANGTKCIAESISKNKGFSIAGGGDTISAIEKFNIEDKISYISTGGGSFLHFLENKKLPAIEILKK